MRNKPRPLVWFPRIVYRAKVMISSFSGGPGARNSNRGFSLTELVVSLLVALILCAIAVPTLMRAYRSYQLNDATARLAGVLKLTRLEAIRKNSTIAFQLQQSGTTWTAWVDANNNGTPDPGETQVVLNGLATLLSSGSVPDTSPIVAVSGALTTQYGGTPPIKFDRRGAVYFPFLTAPSAYVFFLGNTNVPNLGERAIVLLPSGIMQTWSSSSGTWVQLS